MPNSVGENQAKRSLADGADVKRLREVGYS
jgi:hypothetical protein